MNYLNLERKQLIGCALSICLLLPGIGFAEGEDREAPARIQNGILYTSGGIGENQQQLMAQRRKDYTLALTFAMKKTGEYVADVNVLIQNAAHQKLLEAKSTGPFFYAKLPPGTYKISVEFDGKSQSKSTQIKAAGLRELYFYWEGE